MISKKFMSEICNSKVFAEQTLFQRLAVAGMKQAKQFDLKKCMHIGVFGFTRANKIKRLQCSINVLRAFLSKLEVVKGECSGDLKCEEKVSIEIQNVKEKINNLNNQLEKLQKESK